MTCKICGGDQISLGTIPFGRNGVDAPIIDTTPMEYIKCTKCASIECPEMMGWTPEQLGATVYNEDYVIYDPDYSNGVRAKDYAALLKALLPNFKSRHLDYGSGEGLLAKELNWGSFNYDPYSSTTKPEGLFNFITMIEVIEHSSDLDALFKDVTQYLDKRGAIFLSTCLATKNTTIDEPYLAPRNGHINMQSVESMKILATKYGLYFNSISENGHLLQSTRNNFKDLQRGIRIW